tara:strand:+ start:257 stop:640 length:384 start_codon:yes stop_codon:yes gene_type:complete
MVYKLTDEAKGVITPEESIASPLAGETEKVPPAILKVGETETDPSTSTQLVLLKYVSEGESFAVIVMVTDDVLEHDAEVVYDIVYVPGVDVEGVITPEESIASPLAGETEKVPPVSDIVAVITESLD